MFTTKCPQCGKILWFTDKIAGTVTICPACGAKMRLDVEPPTEPQFEPLPRVTPPDDAPPQEGIDPYSVSEAPVEPEKPAPVPDESSLAYRAASAVGEVHVDVDESDLVLWTMQQPPVQAPPSAPPSWAPPALPPPEEPRRVEPPRPAPAEPRRYEPVRRPPDTNGAAGKSDAMRLPPVVWIIVAVAAVALVSATVWLARPTKTVAWDQIHRQEILDIKQSAENLAIAGQYKDAYEKYQELERLIAGQTIQDPYLSQELERAWRRRDLLYDLTISGPRVPVPAPQSAPPIQSNPAPAPAPISTEPSSQPQSSAPPAPPHISVASVSPSPQSPPVIVSAPPILPPRPAARAAQSPAADLTDVQIGDSINKGVNFLLSQFDGPEIAKEKDYHDGLDSLVVYSLMQCGLATHDTRLDVHGEFMGDAIEAMKKLPMTAIEPQRDPAAPADATTQPTLPPATTYGHALRATALALYDRPQDHFIIRRDVDWLLHAQLHGAFTYNDQFARDTDYPFWDNSNSQYGLLGVWSGAETGIRILPQFWSDVQKHWTDDQLPDGQWHYRSGDPEPRRSMTLAGIASLFVTQDYLDADEWGDRVSRPPFSPALAKALAWLETADNCVIDSKNSEEQDWTYTLYGLERVGLASGFKYFGSYEWYRQEAKNVIAAQNADGSWTAPYGDLVGTSYALLFLARGRHPIIMNKLRFGDAWANRPRDAANLARFASAELERPLNWQVVPLNRDWHDWNDARILYLASHIAPHINDADANKLKQYIENGGMLLLQSDGASPQFSAFADKLGKQLFPQYGWTDLPADHPLYSVSYRIGPHAPIRVVTNGSRILMMHWPEDVSFHWQLRDDHIGRWAFELGVNLVLYSAGKSELRNRLASDDIPAASAPAAAALRVARLSYAGNWNPEPQAWPRAARWFRQQTGLDLNIENTPLEKLSASNPPLAHLTGTARLRSTDAQIDAVKKYVEGGGVLVVDPCGGRIDEEFLQSVEQDLLGKAFPDSELSAIDPGHPVLSAGSDGMENVANPALRDYVRSLADSPDPHPRMFKAGKGHVIVLPLDLTSGLLGADDWGIAGYKPDYALALLKNIALWTWDGSKDQ